MGQGLTHDATNIEEGRQVPSLFGTEVSCRKQICGQTWGLRANVVECHGQKKPYRASDPVPLPPVSEEGARTHGKPLARVTSKSAGV